MAWTIGRRLAASAVLSVGLVAGLLANQLLSNTEIREAKAAAGQATAAVEAIRAAEIALGRVSLLERDIRLAVSSADLDRLDAALKERTQSMSTAFADVVARTPESLAQTAAQARDKASAYAVAVGEIATLQRKVVTARSAQADISDRWDRALDSALAHPVMGSLPGRADIEASMQKADAYIKVARIAMWQVMVTGSVNLPEVERSAEIASTHALEASDIAGSGFVVEQSLVTTLASLAVIAPEFVLGVAGARDALQAMRLAAETKVGPLGLETVALTGSAREALAAELARTDALLSAEVESAERFGLALGALVVLLLVGSAVYSSRSVAVPVRRIGEVLAKLAGGTRDVDVPYLTRGDEIGALARSAQAFRESLARVEAMELEQKGQREAAAAQRRSDMLALAQSFESQVGRIAESVAGAAQHLEGAASELTTTAQTTQHLAGKVNGASDVASSNVRAVAASSEELSQSIGEISRQVSEAERIAREAVTQARSADERIVTLSQAAQKIGDVVSLISAIAEQTNLLALNATIEAARAGEAGRGFAVVAAEVKTLAGQTAKATSDIAAQVGAIQDSTREAVSDVQSVGAVITRMAEIATSIAAAVEEQGAATADIARNVQNAAIGTQDVASTIVDVDRRAGETGQASASVLKAARGLAQDGEKLRAEVERFVSSVRAA
jgi:methyl-accepting chemotaxis protein